MLYKNPSSGLQVQKIEIKSCPRPPDHHGCNHTAPAVMLKPPLSCPLYWRWDLAPEKVRSEPAHRPPQATGSTAAGRDRSSLRLAKAGIKLFFGNLLFVAGITD